MGINHAVNEELLENNYQYKKLHEEHSAAERALKEESLRPAVDTSKIAQLKRRKLQLADKMKSIDSAF